MESEAAYLKEHGVEEALKGALKDVLKAQPADPISTIGEALIAMAAGRAPAATALPPVSVDPRGLVDANADQAVDPATAATAASLLSAPSQFFGLTDLSLKKAGLTAVPAAVGQCTLVKKLEISLNPQLSALPDEIRGMRSLRILFALGCGFTHVPPVLAALPSLYMLSFKSNQLTSIGGSDVLVKDYETASRATAGKLGCAREAHCKKFWRDKRCPEQANVPALSVEDKGECPVRTCPPRLCGRRCSVLSRSGWPCGNPC